MQQSDDDEQPAKPIVKAMMKQNECMGLVVSNQYEIAE